MIFKFGKGKKLSEVLRVAEFMEKNNIEYEMLSDITVRVGPEPDVQPGQAVAGGQMINATPINAQIEDRRVRQTPAQNDPLWRAGKPGTGHENCHIEDCKEPIHYGAEPL
jgi:hypothetical protein